MIRKIGVPAHFKGYMFLREAIYTVLNDDGILSSLKEDLYPLVARKFNTAPGKVEASIRYAIFIAWTKRQQEIISEIFGNTRIEYESRPTNAEFIAEIDDKIRSKSI